MISNKIKLLTWFISYTYLFSFIALIVLTSLSIINAPPLYVFLGFWIGPILPNLFVLWKDSRRRRETQISFTMTFFLLPIISTFIFYHWGIICYSRKDQERFSKTIFNVFKKNESLGEKRFNYSTKCSYNNAKVYNETSEWFNDILDKILGANEEICISFFYILQGRNKEALMKALKIKLSQGVKLYLSVDASSKLFGSKNKDLKELERLGALTHLIKPFRGVGSTFSDSLRSHYKFVVIDSLHCFSGGANFGDLYVHQKRKMGYWNDIVFYFEGTGVAAYLKSLFKINIFKDVDLKEVILDKNESKFLEAIENQPENVLNKHEELMMDLIKNCKNRFYITFPYLVIPNWLRDSLIKMAKKGIDVKVVVPGFPDKKSVYTITRKNAKFLSDNGVRIVKLKSTYVHSKLLIVDNTVTSGSCNFDNRSLYINYELMFYVENSFTVDKFLRKWYFDEEELVHWLDEDTKISLWDNIFALLLRVFTTLM